MRLQLCEPGGIRVLDDAYNANADSMLAALQTLRELPCAGRRVAVLGDMAELGEHSAAAHVEVGRRAAELASDHLFAVGRWRRVTAPAARRGGLEQVVEFADVERPRGREGIRGPGDVVLVKASRAMRLERITEVAARRQRRLNRNMHVLLPEPTNSRCWRRTPPGSDRLAVAALPLHHLSQRGRGGDGAGR